MADKRDASAGGSERRRGKGRPFVKGDARTNLRGRPPRAAEISYLQTIKVACPPEDFQAIVRKAVEQAKRGDRYAREWLSKQLGTEAAQKIEQEVRQTLVTAHTDDVAKILADPEATARLLDAVQGPLVTTPADTATAPSEPPPNGNGTNGAGAH